ncbi:ABC transporter ATP-binding protein [Actinoplanes sp. N902-109]|uniref:ABC transporter transmembrane domain-containing protein n=1 Tax=Actinoplanes sp. (strain N902-109) TaxID=649831 RepID=UPI0003294925|nr:ABC transporter ATP-binding protein [Actinoplanes sp. N902-109]AGL15076.1 ABC transporter permease/ATP-binding protein [Actinoplanes sp. N902-109]
MILRRVLTRNARRLWSGSTLIGLHQACEAAIPILIGVIVDRAVSPGDGTALLLWVGVLALLFVMLTMAYRFGARELMKAIAEEAHRLRVEVAAKILHPRGIRTDYRAGDLLTVSTTDADEVSYLIDYVPRIAGAVVATAVSAATLLLISVPLGLVVLVATPIVLVVLQVSAPLITKRVADQQDRAGRATSLATDLVTGLRPLRGIGAQDAAAARYREVSRLSLAATLRASRTQGGYLAASTALSTLLACGIAILAGWFALTGRITVGQFITVIGSAQFLIEPFGLLAIVPSWIAEARASAERVAKVVDAPAILPEGVAEPVAERCELRLTGVRHGSLAGVDLHVRAGEFVGVVAHRPADAEALVKLLAMPTEYEGTILLAGEPLDLVDRDHARRLLLVEPHHADLFTGTIASNLLVQHASPTAPLPTAPLPTAPLPTAPLPTAPLPTAPLPTAPLPTAPLPTAPLPTAPLSTAPVQAASVQAASVRAALVAAAADEVIAAQPGGLDEPVAERGASLSGGQRQRLALARALLARPPVLVLHDPTTAVDAVTEHAIAHGIRALRHGPDAGFATVVITSSPALLAATDRVVVLGEGVVTAAGSHADLGAADDSYREVVLR